MLRSLDYVYTPSADPDAEAARWVETLGAELLWKIRRFGTVVACLRVSDSGPAVILAGHLEGDVPILVYRVDDLAATVASLRAAGLDVHEFGLPPGPAARVDAPGGQPFAVYELTRPGRVESFAGRFDEPEE
jgi:hypothetical protein